MEKSNIVIRPAVKEDMKHVYEMIKELAVFENLENQVEITVETLEQDGFDTPNPAFHCFVAEFNNTEVIGYALYYYCYSTWRGKSVFLEDLYVKPACRSLGAGKKLFYRVAKVAHNLCKRLDFHCLAWNPADNFYKSLGACDLTESEEWHLFRLDHVSLDRLFA